MDIIRIGNTSIKRGEMVNIDLPVANLPTHTQLTMPIQIIRGVEDGPVLFVSAAIHGDELNGVEIIYRLLQSLVNVKIKGTLIAVPVVNIYGFMENKRYLPDRRDLNRSFPGSEKGTMASRLAHLFMTEIVAHCTHGVDIHTGSNHRTNLPQIRINTDDSEAKKLALSFGAPLVVEAALRDGSLRDATDAMKIPVLVYEAGEALRFNKTSINIGVRGILNIMQEIGMIDNQDPQPKIMEPLVVSSSTWIRAPESGILRSQIKLGSRVKKREVIGTVSDSFGHNEVEIIAPKSGLVIGCLLLPLVNEGEALFHIVPFKSEDKIDAMWEEFQADVELDINYDVSEFIKETKDEEEKE